MSGLLSSPAGVASSTTSADSDGATSDSELSASCGHVTEDPTILNQCVHWHLESAAEKYKHNKAVICGETTLTYHELHLRANAFACHLIERGVEKGHAVGVSLDRSVDLIVALIAVLKSGAAYLPIDPALPEARIAQILDNAAPRFVVVDAETSRQFSRSSCECISFEQDAKSISTANSRKLNVEVQPHDLAYIIYTSGSTGQPKGVEISHSAASNFLSSMQRVPGVCDRDRGLAISTIAFDMAFFEIFAPLVSGATVVMARTGQSRDPQALARLMVRHQVTMMLATPTTWQMLLDSGWRGEPRLRHIMCGGESLSRRLADQLLDCGDAVWNKYGPTEATACASIWRVRRNEPVLIGEPVTNVHLYILDPDLKPVSAGVSGELFIGGAGVAVKYHKNEELTRSSFLANPFHQGRMYRTGDLARLLSPGKLVMIGRADNQVKIRGNRVELGDIESAIAAHPDVSNTAVISRSGSLIAYCVRQSIAAPTVDDDDSRVAEWTTISDQFYRDDNTTAGWLNSYDRSPFSADEMQDWFMSSVSKILSFAPQRVFEIGSGTGMLLFQIAPSCSSYVATDSSKVVVERTRKRLESMPHAVYEHFEAHKLPVADKLYDTIIINSVIQCFPSIDYLFSVLSWAVDAIDVGRVFLGDLRDLRFLSVFHHDIIKCRAGGTLDQAELERRAYHAIRGDSELVLSPDFFANLSSLLPRISSVDVTLRQGRYANEMTCFRFDVVVHVGMDITYLPTKESDWDSSESVSIILQRNLSSTEEKSAIRINGIPNGRLRETYYRLTSKPDWHYSDESWVDPSLLMEIGKGHNLHSALLPSQKGDIWTFDVIFWSRTAGATPNLTLHEPESLDQSSLKTYANEHLVTGTNRTKLKESLRPWLAERLPEYMIPAHFVELDSIPLTFNGKVDRNNLPHHTKSLDRVIQGPTNDLQRDILTVWSSVLDRDDIDIHDNFFEIGGDSVRIVRVQTGLEKLLGRKISVGKLFQYFTIQKLAESLFVGDETGEFASKRISSEAPADGIEDIAIVSMACRLPGGIESPAEFWTLLETGGDAISVVPKDRWDADAIYDPDPSIPGKSHCRHGGFLASSAIDAFDAPFFNMSITEAREVDPTQRIMLETSWEAFERAGYTKQQLKESSTGVFIGISNIPAHHDCEHAMALTEFQGYAGTGSAGATTSGRISYVFGLEGPCLTVDTACSSSLVSTHLACASLRQGECDMAISGGVALLRTPALHVEFTKLRGLALDGRCRSFSDDAQGVGFAEGAAAVVLKRLSDAQRDGDLIHAVLRGTAVNHDGRTASLTTPSAAAQSRLIRTALNTSKLHPADVDYVEAHGTGTTLGDPIEGEGLAKAYGGQNRDMASPLLIGTAKSNIGHAQAAAGLVGLLKVVLALEHSLLPRTLHATTPTSAIDWHDANMVLVQKNRSWSRDTGRKRRAGISAFGIGGTNAHIIVEETPKPIIVNADDHRQSLVPAPVSVPWVPVVLSGLSPQALRDQAKRLHAHMEGNDDRLIDVAFTLAVKRNHFPYRQVFNVQSKTDLIEKLSNYENTAGDKGKSSLYVPPRLAMLFTGQGGELLNAGRNLAMQDLVFYNALMDVASHFDGILGQPLLKVMEATENTELSALLRQTNYAQPALFTLQVALWRWWEHLGVRPDFVLGHSVGEIAAAHVAGIMSLADACRLVATRGQLMHSISSQGTMLSVEAGASDVTAMIRELNLERKVDIAAYNTPDQTVVSGDHDAIEQLTPVFRQRGRRATALATSRAFHSHHINSIRAQLLAVAETIHYSQPTTPIVSGLTGQLAQDGQLQQATYWVDQARQAVHLKDGIEVLARENISVFLELGPQPILCGLGAACLAEEDVDSLLWCPSLDHRQGDSFVLQGSLAKLHERHVRIDWSRYFAPWDCAMVDLPTYAFQRESLPRGPGRSRPLERVESPPHEKVSPKVEDDDEHCGLFQVDWQPVDGAGMSSVTGDWGVLSMDKNSVATASLVSILTGAKLNVIFIDNIADGEQLDGILCLWPSGPMDPVQACDTTELAISQLQYAARRQLRQPLVWITAHAMSVKREQEQVDDGHTLLTAPLWGLMRTARAENPEMHLRLIGTASEMSEISLSNIPTSLGLIDEPELLLENDKILVPRLGRADEVTYAVEVPLVREGGAVLITGGFGELGQNAARWLVSTHGVRDLILTSRRGAETHSARALLAELTQWGARVEAVAGDIADIDHLRSVLVRFGAHRPLRGIIHAAGVSSAGMLTSLQKSSCRSAFASKVTGSWNLHQLTKTHDLDFFVLCSSLSAVMSTPGFAPYAAANSFLDALAHERHAKGLPASSVAFGAFEGGMSSGLTRARRVHLAQSGVGFFNSDQVLKALEKAIQSKRALTVAVKLDLDCLQNYYKSQGETLALFRSLLVGPNSHSVVESQTSFRDELMQTAPASRQKVCVQLVTKVVAETLGFAEKDIDADKPLQDIGLDSFTATSMRNHLVKLTGTQLSTNVLFLHPTPGALGRFILTKLLPQAPSSLTSPQVGSTSISLDRKAICEGSLDRAFSFDNVKSVLKHRGTPKEVFVTGATGFVGAFLVHELLQRGVTTHCIVRGDDDRQARQRLVKTLALYDLWKEEYKNLLIVVAGDMALYQFGLDDERFSSFADHVDTICHAGGLVDWMRPFEDYVGPNIISTHEVLRLANTGQYKAVHVVSTIATLPFHSGCGLCDSDPEHGYATSKWISERLVSAARWRGAKASVYRLPYVTAATSEGQFRLDKRDFLHNMIVGSIEMGVFPRVDADLSLVLPVDYLCRSMVTVMMQEPHRIGHDFDFVNGHAISFDTYCNLFAPDPESRIAPFSTWRQQALNHAMADPTSALARISPVLDGCTDQDFAAMFRVLPPGQHVLGGRDYPAPPMDGDYVSKYRRRIDRHRSADL